jgi:hypothetical protein
MSRKHLISLAVLLAVGGAVRASDPVGVYAIIDRAEVTPSTGPAERLQLWGVFALATEGKGNSTYSPPLRGTMSFAIVKGKEDVCRKEWADLVKVAGSKQCVAFGSRYKVQPAVRKGGDPTKNLDVYPLGFGVTKVPGNNYMAKKLLAAPPDAGKDKAPKDKTKP